MWVTSVDDYIHDGIRQHKLSTIEIVFMTFKYGYYYFTVIIYVS